MSPETRLAAADTAARVHYGSARLGLTFLTNAIGTVEKLVEEGAKREEIVEAMRQDAPELADVVDRRAPTTSPDFREWVRDFLTLVALLFALYAHYHPQPLSEADIARIADEVVERLQASESSMSTPPAG